MRCSIMKVLVGGSLALIPAMCSAQEPIKVTPCDLVTTPEKYSGKFVQVTGRVYLAFEDFSLAQPGCEDAYPGVWLDWHEPCRGCGRAIPEHAPSPGASLGQLSISSASVSRRPA